MNCQDITRLIDSGKYSAIPATDKHDAEAHAKTCSHCAPLWIMHASLSSIRRPPMPAELSVRCLTLAAAELHAVSPRRISRVTGITIGLVLLAAAAASLLAVDFFSTPAAPVQPVVGNAVSTTSKAAPEAPLRAEAPPAEPAPAPSAVAEAKEGPYSLPLIPAPAGFNEGRMSESRMALLKALELYPQLTQGADIDGHFVVSLNLKSNGTVLGNSLAIAHDADELNAESHKMQPLDGSQTFTGWSKSKPLEGGRTLRGDLTLVFSVVPDSFDVTRANARVQEIVRAERGHLLMNEKGGINTLTVLLTESGGVDRENVEFVAFQSTAAAVEKPPGPETRAADMARKLGVDIERIGLMGSTLIDDPSADPASRRRLLINYAWPRRAGEARPVFGQSGNRSIGTAIDHAAALLVVERVLPEAFLQADSVEGPPTSRPLIVFTTEGKVIGTGRLNMQSGEPFEQQIQKIAPGVETYTNTSFSVRNVAGKSAQLHFVWEATPIQKEELAKTRKSAVK
jgi:hypothetical protein